ncbi:MAG TPA: hypothetical protein VMW94_04665, partial [Actinomycetes bacterium]|nr:hypothetical protein [Actinomycetes bacterium]
MQDVEGQQIQQGGEALSNLGAHVTDIATRINEDHALATAKGALNEWSEYADQSDQEYRQSIGRAASEIDGKSAKPGEAPRMVAERMEDKMREVEGKLSSDLAKRMFRQHAERGMVAIRGRLGAHEAAQIKVHDHGESVAQFNRMGRAYIADPDPKQLSELIDVANDLATDASLGKEQRAEYLLAKKTELHAGRVSHLLDQDDPKGADAYLRAQERGDIDVTVRGKLRKKIDTVLETDGAQKLGIDLVTWNGYPSERVWKESQVPPPPKLKVEFQDPGDAFGPPPLPGADPPPPRTLDEEIIAARLINGDPVTDPSTGTYKRSMDYLAAEYKAGRLSAKKYQMAQVAVRDQIGRAVDVRNAQGAEALKQVEKILQAGEHGSTIDSPEFQAAFPDLREQLVDLGLETQARRLTETVFERETLPEWRDRLYKNPGALRGMSYDELYTTYYDKFDKTDWNAALRMWDGQNPGKSAGKIVDDPITTWERSVKDFLGGRGIINRDPKTQEYEPQTSKELLDWHDLTRDLNKALKTGDKKVWTNDDVKKWVAARELDMVSRPVIQNSPHYMWRMLRKLPSSSQEEPQARYKMEEERDALVSAVADLRTTGASPKAIKAAEKKLERYDGRIGVMVDGQWVKTGTEGTRASFGFSGEEIPPRASMYIKDWFRLQQLRSRVGVSLSATQFGV